MKRLDLFSTPIFVYELDGSDVLNRELKARLLAESARDPGVSRSNEGGWHSRPDLATRKDPVYEAVMEMVLHHVQATVEQLAEQRRVGLDCSLRFGLTSWAMVMRQGDYTIPHDHAPAHFATAYYVDAGDADLAAHPSSGTLAVMDPRQGVPSIGGIDLFPSTLNLQPRTGSLVVFPGWLTHYVHPYRGARPRISISCNVKIDVAPAQSA